MSDRDGATQADGHAGHPERDAVARHLPNVGCPRAHAALLRGGPALRRRPAIDT
ncbi:MAG TPA: hypothetical protein VJO52_07660 [Gemmatimonadaceae bacterium]|nr:hypothetical protein [Gemmatimonadaceae bacterium]